MTPKTRIKGLDELELAAFCNHFLLPWLLDRKNTVLAYSMLDDDGCVVMVVVWSSEKLGIRDHRISNETLRRIWTRLGPGKRASNPEDQDETTVGSAVRQQEES